MVALICRNEGVLWNIFTVCCLFVTAISAGSPLAEFLFKDMVKKKAVLTVL